MFLDAQHLIDAHQNEGFVFDQVSSRNIWYAFDRDRDNASCGHGVIPVQGRLMFESDHVIMDDSGDSDLAEALRNYFERIGDGGNEPQENGD